MATDAECMAVAIAEAEAGLAEGGIPIGSVLAGPQGIIATGHNRRVQQGDPIAHGEMDCLRRAGRLRSYRGLTLYTTLSPCMMCTGTIIQFRIGRVVIGENRTFGGNEDLLRSRGVDVTVLADPKCVEMMQAFQRNHPDIWREDIGE
ncbi:MAG TPA: nucleoside deaminase [Stellaceae bacterium]|jgi:cytosine deaminase|nr:nucleoside deaminase [Stellaceae bacterium]